MPFISGAGWAHSEPEIDFFYGIFEGVFVLCIFGNAIPGRPTPAASIGRTRCYDLVTCFNCRFQFIFFFSLNFSLARASLSHAYRVSLIYPPQERLALSLSSLPRIDGNLLHALMGNHSVSDACTDGKLRFADEVLRRGSRFTGMGARVPGSFLAPVAGRSSSAEPRSRAGRLQQ